MVRSLTRLCSGQAAVLTDQPALLSCPRQVSYFEIYLDKIRDLLDGEMRTKRSSESEKAVGGRGP